MISGPLIFRIIDERTMLAQQVINLDPSQAGSWVPWAIGVAVAVVAALACFGLLYRHQASPQQSPAQKADPLLDPFIHGSGAEKRTALRRVGSPTAVLISDAEALGPPVHGQVIDRSMGGVGMTIDGPIEVGAILSVRVANATALIPWVQVEVKNCRQT